MKIFTIILLFLTVSALNCYKSKNPLFDQMVIDGNWKMTHYSQDQEYYWSFYFSDQKNGWAVGQGGKTSHLWLLAVVSNPTTAPSPILSPR